MSETFSLIQVSQLMMTIPLMNVNLPANVQAVFFSMQNMISFNFIPVSSLPMYSWFVSSMDMATLEFSEEETSFGERFETYGYPYRSMI
jgi:hypothetical protein